MHMPNVVDKILRSQEVTEAISVEPHSYIIMNISANGIYSERNYSTNCSNCHFSNKICHLQSIIFTLNNHTKMHTWSYVILLHFCTFLLIQ